MVSSKRLSFFPSRKIALSLSKGSELRVATFYDLPGIPSPIAFTCPFPIHEMSKRKAMIVCNITKFIDDAL
jgi:hypothetical protein